MGDKISGSDGEGVSYYSEALNILQKPIFSLKTEKKNQLKVVPEKYKGALVYQQSLFSGIKFRHKHRKIFARDYIYIYKY